jgi:hypothetical protein
MGDVTTSATMTKQPILVIFSLTLPISTQTFGQHQQSPLMRYARHDGQPNLVVNFNHQPGTHVLAFLMIANKSIGQQFQLL